MEYPDLPNLTRDEILEEYHKLFDRFKELHESNEIDAQKIFELKRNLDTATAAQTYLSQELEQYVNTDNKENEIDFHKTQTELKDMKKKYSEVVDSYCKLQDDYGVLLIEKSKISKYVERSVRCKKEHLSDMHMKREDYLLQIEILANENTELLSKIEELEERSMDETRVIAEYEKNMEMLRDQIVCLEENFKSKKSELEETRLILESTQDQLAEANAKIAKLSAAPNNEDRKGNSLFAEVDDQRQAMKKLLADQKKSYKEMKKIYDESEYEKRRLKHENIAMHTELETCSKIFCDADKVYQEKLNERIANLINQTEYLEGKLKWTQERLKDMADNRGDLCINSMLMFCKKETNDLKDQLHSARIQKASLEDQLRNTQQNMARWRFESLKSRCVLIDREHLLTENKISFKPVHALEYNISEKVQAEAKPRIVSTRRGSIFQDIYVRNAKIPPKDNSTEQEEGSPQQNSDDISKEKLSNIIADVTEDSNTATFEQENKEQIKINTDPIDTSRENKEDEKTVKYLSSIELQIQTTNSNESNIENVVNEVAENNSNIDDVPVANNFAKLKTKPRTPMRPSQRLSEKVPLKKSPRSILTKENDAIFKNSVKRVKFFPNGDTVHNLSADVSHPLASSTSDVNIENKNTSKRPRVKSSNVVVRRIVVSSKHD